jgi:predicted RNase H-like HicB family nuclease
MSLKNDRYTYRVTWSEDDNEYVGLCAEFPSLSWLSKTLEAALKGIRKVVAEIVNDMQSTGETIPALISVKHYSGKFMVRVPPEVHRKLFLCALLERTESMIKLMR